MKGKGYKINRRKSRRRFTKSASRTHYFNIVGQTPRGGYRL